MVVIILSKNFKDFIKTLTKDKLENILSSDETSFDFSLDNKGFQKFTNQIQASDFKIMLNLLEAYNDWLND